jgi:hypothetical protein
MRAGLLRPRRAMVRTVGRKRAVARLGEHTTSLMTFTGAASFSLALFAVALEHRVWRRACLVPPFSLEHRPRPYARSPR